MKIRRATICPFVAETCAISIAKQQADVSAEDQFKSARKMLRTLEIAR